MFKLESKIDKLQKSVDELISLIKEKPIEEKPIEKKPFLTKEGLYNFKQRKKVQ